MKRRMIADSLIYQYQRCAESKLKQSYDGRCITMFHQIEDDVGKWYDSRYAISFSSFTMRLNISKINSLYSISASLLILYT